MKPVPFQNQFNNGMKRDVSRNRMPPNSVWNAIDFIWDYGAPARERAGWAYASSDMDAITASASYVQGGIYATFSPTAGATEVNLAVDEDGYVYKVALSGTPAATGVGAGVPIAQNPVFHGGTAVSSATAVYTGLIIIPDGTGANVPKKYDGTTLSNLNGTPPKAKYATVYKDYTALANGTVGTVQYPNRVWWSPAGDPDCGFSGAVTAWDTTDAWNDFSLPVIGLAATKNVMLVFHDGQISRIRGNTPPPEEDMVVDDPWQKIGLLDAFSITEYSDQIYFCAPEGVYRTDGVSMDDITLKGGMARYWLDLVSRATSSWTFATGIIRNKLIISVMDGGTFKDAFIVDLQSYAWGRLSNIKALSFWTGQYGDADETYFGSRAVAGEVRVARLNTMFDVDSSSYNQDADGRTISSVLETAFMELGRPGMKTIKGIHVGYYLKDWSSDDPIMEVSYTDTPEAKSEDLGSWDWESSTAGNEGWGISDAALAPDRSTAQKRFGSASLRVRADGTQSYASVYSPTFTAVPGNYIAASGWFYPGPDTVNVSIFISWYNSVGTWLTTQSGLIDLPASQWTRGSYGPILIPATAGTAAEVVAAASMAVAFSRNGTFSASATAGYVDGARLQYATGELGYLSENTKYDRKRLSLGGRHYGLALKFARIGPGDFHGFDISAEVGFQEESKRMR